MTWPPRFKSEAAESFEAVSPAGPPDLMQALRERVEVAREAIRERERKTHVQQFGDYWASKQDDPPEWWDDES